MKRTNKKEIVIAMHYDDESGCTMEFIVEGNDLESFIDYVTMNYMPKNGPQMFVFKTEKHKILKVITCHDYKFTFDF